MTVIAKPHKGFKDVLTVRIFHGHFKVVHFLRGVVKGVYLHPAPVTTLDDIAAALDRAIVATGFTGKLVTFLYEGEEIEHSFVTTPPMETKDLRLFLGRKAEQEKQFEGRAAFSYTLTASPKGGHIVLLTLSPRTFVDGLTEICRVRGLFIQKLIPASAVMGHLMSQLGYAADNVIGLVAEVGGRLSLLVGKGNGALMFDRHFNYNWRIDKDAERIGREIERSLLFAKQQFGQSPEAVIFIGDYGDSFEERMKSLITLPIVIGEHQTYEHYWLTEARQIRRTHASNLIPANVRFESTRHATTKVVTVMVALFWIGAIGAAGLVEALIAKSESDAKRQGGEVARLQEEKAHWLDARAELERRKRVVDRIASPPPPAPAWFLGYLGDAVPEGIALSDVAITRQDDRWNVTLNGIVLLPPHEVAPALASLEKGLVEGPYRLAVEGSWREGWLKDLSTGGAASPGRRFTFEMKGGFR